MRRLLVMRDADSISVSVAGTPDVSPGQLVVAGTEVAPGIILEESGQVVKVIPANGTALAKIVLRIARPYRVSGGAVLHVDDGDLVQRGDNLVILVFERAKTGDIIQGLPRIEELLEGRKPKEACILAKRPGTARVVTDDDVVELAVIEDDGRIEEYPLLPGQNPIVSDGQRVGVAEALTDGPANPHEILEVFFHVLKERQPTFEAALESFQPYFSGPKIKWMLDNIPGLREDAIRGNAIFGTVPRWRSLFCCDHAGWYHLRPRALIGLARSGRGAG